MLTVGGIDDNSTQLLNARQTYAHTDIRWQHNYVDIIELSTEGRLVLDYGKFHDVIPENAPPNGDRTVLGLGS